jgi:hypothetical protein
MEIILCIAQKSLSFHSTELLNILVTFRCVKEERKYFVLCSNGTNAIVKFDEMWTSFTSGLYSVSPACCQVGDITEDHLSNTVCGTLLQK